MSKWIPVAERLPERSGFYLVTVYDWYRVGIAEYLNNIGWREEYVFDKVDGVIAWMPLPGKYERKEE